MKTFSRPLSQQQNPNRVGPIRKPGLDLLEKDELKAKRPSMWNIVFYNDDYTLMDFVGIRAQMGPKTTLTLDPARALVSQPFSPWGFEDGLASEHKT
jgi:hypothetical protein